MEEGAAGGSSVEEQGYRMLWGALARHDRARLGAIVRARVRRVPRSLAVTITEATQSLEIQGRLIPHVLVAAADRHHGLDQTDDELDQPFVDWILDHERA